ncbi:hypothetical protein CJ030_MR7G029147 [Morella rubra]|uniref:Uncharacterized protein n=1 Tax=Morella rubra TaxID=262757 RepID=A0A6A1V749_9ROSI|nr:hypothetical protein CJ030_MR7G029147 [Morella rubra]
MYPRIKLHMLLYKGIYRILYGEGKYTRKLPRVIAIKIQESNEFNVEIYLSEGRTLQALPQWGGSETQASPYHAHDHQGSRRCFFLPDSSFSLLQLP